MTEFRGDKEKHLIVNADDYGYYDCVTRGVLLAADAGVVRATGIFANSPFVENHVPLLKTHDSLDAGVHLNLTDRQPITDALKSRFRRWGGNFPGKFRLVRELFSGRLPLREVRDELAAQIERVRSFGVDITFINSHEHLHMLPPLFRITQDLAREYGVTNIRFSTPDSIGVAAGPGALARDCSLRVLNILNRRQLDVPTLPFLGMGFSGKLEINYLRRMLTGLTPGVYELMCHPGDCSDRQVENTRHRAYHDWRGELDTLLSADFRDLCVQENIRLIGYRDL